MKLPNKIFNYVKGLSYKIDTLGRSGDTIILYEDKFVLKISNNVNRIENESNKLIWLNNKLPTPKVIEFVKEGNIGYLLETMLKGKSLSSKEFIENPSLLCNLLAKAFFLVNSVNPENCPYLCPDCEGNDFVHGDFCLPNILSDGVNITGFVDLDSCGLGDKLFDVAWACWSIHYNTKSFENIEIFCKKINIPYDKKTFEKYVSFD